MNRQDIGKARALVRLGLRCLGLRYLGLRCLGLSGIVCILLVAAGSAQQQNPAGSDQTEKLQVNPPRVQLPRITQYSPWAKLCFKGSDGATICRTTSSGMDDTGQVVLRVDLIERADGPARLQLFVPQGFNLPAGVRVTVDRGAPTPVPYNWCLTNICIAAGPVVPSMVGEMESGQTLKIEQGTFNASMVATNVPLDKFSTAHKGPPETYDFGLDDD
jgi:invasion protein IalB